MRERRPGEIIIASLCLPLPSQRAALTRCATPAAAPLSMDWTEVVPPPELTEFLRGIFCSRRVRAAWWPSGDGPCATTEADEHGSRLVLAEMRTGLCPNPGGVAVLKSGVASEMTLFASLRTVG